MTQLADLQQSLATAMFDVALPPPNSIRGARRRSVARRFDIHRNKIAAGLIEALANRYPVTRRLIGPESFNALARLYCTQYPPRSPVLLSYGDGFPRFVRNLGSIPSIEYLADIADLESTFGRAYHAADATPLAVDVFSRLGPDLLEDLVVSFHPSVSLVASRFPVVSIWQANQSDDECMPVTRWAAEAAVVARPDHDVEVSLLPAGGHTFLAALMKGATLAEATQTATAQDADFDLTTNLETLIGARICVGIDNLALLAA
jgi:hypothetical protein